MVDRKAWLEPAHNKVCIISRNAWLNNVCMVDRIAWLNKICTIDRIVRLKLAHTKVCISWQNGPVDKDIHGRQNSLVE